MTTDVTGPRLTHGIPRSRTVCHVAVVFLLVLAGCNAGLGGTVRTPTEGTVTPAPVPTDSVLESPDPPGVSAAGVTEASTLEETHLRTLENATFRERARTTIRLEDRSIAIEEVYTGRHGTNATSITLRRSGTTRYPVPDRSLVEAGVWENESFEVHRFVTAHGRVELGSVEGPGVLYRRPRGGYGLAFRDAESAVESRRIVNGSVEYVLVASGVDVRGPWYFRESFMRVREPGRVRAVVTSRGTIRQFVVEFPIVLDGRNATLRHTYAVEIRDVTVTRPTWFDEAVASEESVPFSLPTRPLHRYLGGRNDRSSGRTSLSATDVAVRDVVVDGHVRPNGAVRMVNVSHDLPSASVPHEVRSVVRDVGTSATEEV